MDRSSGISGPGQNHAILSHNSPDSLNNRQNANPTRGLRDLPAHEVSQKSLPERSVAEAEPTSYLGWLAASAAEITSAAALFSYDLANTTYQTLAEGLSSLGEGATEVSKLGIGTLGLAASLAQAGLAAAGELADATGMAIPDSTVDMLSLALAQAGIQTTGIPKSALRQLAMSVAWLHMGSKQDIHINQGALELPAGSEFLGKGASLRVSNIHLEGLQPGILESGKTDGKSSASDSLTVKADRLSFEVEYRPSGTTGESQQEPVTLSVDINQPELTGESNLISLVATAINRYCSGLPYYLPGASVSGNDKAAMDAPVWDQEETSVQLRSQSAYIAVKNIRSLVPDMDDYIPEVANLSLIDLNAGVHQSLTGDRTTKPNLFFKNLEIRDDQADPLLQLRKAQMKLDEDLNGSLDIMVQTPFSRLDYFINPIPSAMKTLIKNHLPGAPADSNSLGIMIHLDVVQGDIDLNTLTSLGISDRKLSFLQKQIEAGVVRALNSEHTRLRDLPSGNKEFKLDYLAMSGKTPGLIKNKLHGMATRNISGYFDLGDQPSIKTAPKSRGKISLTELLGINPGPDANPQQPS